MADAKLTALTSTATIATTDLVYVVGDPSGTPASYSATIASLASAMSIGGSQLVTLGNIGTTAGTIPLTNIPGITEVKFSLSDNTTANASTTAHGLLPKLSGASTQYLNGAGGWATPANSVSGTFNNTSLAGGVLVVTHNEGLSAPYPLAIQVYNNSNKMVIPDDIEGHADTHEIDLTSYGTIAGTWGYIYVA